METNEGTRLGELSGELVEGGVGASIGLGLANKNYILGNLKNKINLAKKASSAVPGVGLGLLTYDAVTGAGDAEATFNTTTPTAGQKAASGVYNMADGLLLGQIQDKAAKTREMYNFYNGLFN